MSAFDSRLCAMVEAAVGSRPLRMETVAAGLGAHHFSRVVCEDGQRVVVRRERDQSAGSGPEPPLEGIRSFLEAAGLPVPRRYGGGEGIEILEDLGGESLGDRVAVCSGEEKSQLYQRACLLIARIQRLEAPRTALPAFERHLLDFLPLKCERTTAVSLPAWLGREATTAERDCVRSAFAEITQAVREAPSRLAHRDFQSSNVLLRDDELFLIDLQGAFLAPPEYDLVCLLRDSYVVLPPGFVDAQIDAVRPALPDPPSAEAFRRRFDLLTIARKAKDDAFFVEAARRGDTRYLSFREANRRYLHEASQRLAETTRCFEPWVEWLAAPSEDSQCAQ